MINLNKVKYLHRLYNSYCYVKLVIVKILRILKDQKFNRNPKHAVISNLSFLQRRLRCVAPDLKL